MACLDEDTIVAFVGMGAGAGARLSSAAIEGVDAHVHGCAACRDLLSAAHVREAMWSDYRYEAPGHSQAPNTFCDCASTSAPEPTPGLSGIGVPMERVLTFSGGWRQNARRMGQVGE